MKKDLFSLLREHVSVNQKHQESIQNHSCIKIYPKGSLLLKAPEISNCVWYLEEGILRYFSINEEGEAKTEMFLEPGDFFTDLTSFWEQISTEGFVEALTKTKVRIFERCQYESLKREIPFWNEVVNRICKRHMQDQLLLSRRLIHLNGTQGYQLMTEKYSNIVNNVPAVHLASFIGISPHSLSRIKRKQSLDR
ncbi:Crp/Fnr family transcriptional regulator [Neolewinella aurantiaca]|uniref:Crp/Fnr family transcriptional regulator n=1 Tax=Neolewinella aurantiaca TaxID=2602767 RepID=A0A5C7G0M8_9BACT|nr:Crp/Fnr family transcriptional regulator [Neolewinella aurantiaca]TXF91793.1 Crp/Fnr family transcriptional regulator [Neolewinella aurantiaca]